MTAIKGKPIIMQSESVRAILDGRKTKTRRVADKHGELDGYEPHLKSSGKQHQNYGADDNYYFWFSFTGDNPPLKENLKAIKCPYPVGTRVWVREAWSVSDGTLNQKYIYKADGNPRPDVIDSSGYISKGRWRLSIFMPKAASRITLEITDVRVERLWDITEEDAKAEGMQKHQSGKYWRGAPHAVKGTDRCMISAIEAYKDIWNSINKKRGYSWESNPFVWCYSFKKVEAKK